MQSACPHLAHIVAPASRRLRRAAPFPFPVSIAAALIVGGAPLAVAQTPPSAAAAVPTASSSTHPYAGHVAEASRRFGIPETWIWSVMRVESAGDQTATSHAGAIGLMQVMPGTYAELRSRYGLGPNAYDPRDNILAGTAYLREMHDRYGSAGFLAAYNAGPGRWEDHLTRDRPLPAETVAYMARLGPEIGGSAAPSLTPPAPMDRLAWTRASLFVRVSLGDEAAVGVQDLRPRLATEEIAPLNADSRSTGTSDDTADALFAVRGPR